MPRVSVIETSNEGLVLRMDAAPCKGILHISDGEEFSLAIRVQPGQDVREQLGDILGSNLSIRLEPDADWIAEQQGTIDDATRVDSADVADQGSINAAGVAAESRAEELARNFARRMQVLTGTLELHDTVLEEASAEGDEATLNFGTAPGAPRSWSVELQ